MKVSAHWIPDTPELPWAAVAMPAVLQTQCLAVAMLAGCAIFLIHLEAKQAKTFSTGPVLQWMLNIKIGFHYYSRTKFCLKKKNYIYFNAAFRAFVDSFMPQDFQSNKSMRKLVKVNTFWLINLFDSEILKGDKNMIEYWQNVSNGSFFPKDPNCGIPVGIARQTVCQGALVIWTFFACQPTCFFAPSPQKKRRKKKRKKFCANVGDTVSF